MKKLALGLLLFAFCFIAVPRSTLAQYVAIDYMKVEQGGDAEYVAVEQSIWKKIHQKRLDEGLILAWYLFAVDYPYGSATKYNYVTVNIFESIEKMEMAQYPDEIVASAGDVEAISARTNASRKLVWSEVYRLVDRVGPPVPSVPRKYVNVAYMKVKTNVADYLSVEQDLWKPVHEKRHETGMLDVWALYERVFPGGTDYGSEYLTVNTHASMVEMMAGYPDTLIESAYPDGVPEDFSARTGASRDIVKAALWRLLDYVQ